MAAYGPEIYSLGVLRTQKPHLFVRGKTGLEFAGPDRIQRVHEIDQDRTYAVGLPLLRHRQLVCDWVPKPYRPRQDPLRYQPAEHITTEQLPETILPRALHAALENNRVALLARQEYIRALVLALRRSGSGLPIPEFSVTFLSSNSLQEENGLARAKACLSEVRDQLGYEYLAPQIGPKIHEGIPDTVDTHTARPDSPRPHAA